MKAQTYTIAPSFHNFLDSDAYYWPGKGTTTTTTTRTEQKHMFIQERTLGYRFYPHFHHYVPELVRRLLELSVRGLQAADTEYQTVVELSAVTPARAGDGALFQIGPGQKVRLRDGAVARLADATVVRFAGEQVLKQADESRVDLAAGTAITLPAKTAVRRAAGWATVDNDSPAKLVDGSPRPILYEQIFTSARYNPSNMVRAPYPLRDLDFTSSGAYSAYNWELFFHVPLTVAMHLSKNQRYQEAQRWFHYIFDPTDDSEGPTPERFWKVRPFQSTDVRKAEEILINLVTAEDEDLRAETIASIGAWKDNPFRPHVIARYRQSAYMFKSVMAYLDNLIAWGDSLFRQDTGETINEAMTMYVLAANILGPKPQVVPAKGTVRHQTYANLRADLGSFGTVMRDLEADLALDVSPFPLETGDNDRLAVLRGLGKALYFCVPRNDKLLSYWDTVADRLFKIRNSLNIQGVFRQLPLFEAPIDPALLARAAAAGLDIGATVSGANQPLPLVRFQLLLAKATEFCQEVKSLGNSLLSNIEKEDSEAMAVLRARHERKLLEMSEHVRYAQLQEAIKAREGLLRSLGTAIHRYTYYERQLGKELTAITAAIPLLDDLDIESLTKLKFKMQEPELALPDEPVDISRELGDEGGGRILSSQEVVEIKKLGAARDLQDQAAVKDKIAAGLSLIPELGVNFKFWGIGGHLEFGGSALSKAMSFWASFAKTDADKLSYEAGSTAKIGGYARREQDWALQSNLAAAEISQTFKQLRAAQIREAIAEREWKNHKQQIDNARQVEHFLNEEGVAKDGKKSNRALYAWMKREVRGLYGQSLQFATDVARKAERALQHELGNTQLTFIQPGYLGGREGLLAGEKLYLDLKRMEMAYHEQNQREYELTKHISLMQVDPLALLQLRTTGRCTVLLPEDLFDMDGPGHYFRRIKSVALSIPSVTGPYTSINCTLTLLKSAIRKGPNLRDGAYVREGADDDRFSDHFGSIASIVTSTGQNDTGMFETNLRDERYLPFEASGVISEWQVELPREVRQFDYDTIADVILHVRYTAREGGALLRSAAVGNLTARIDEAQAAGSVRMFSLRHDFPTEWSRFKGATIAAATPFAELSINLRDEHYPFWSNGRREAVRRFELFARTAVNTVTVSDTSAGGQTDALVKDAVYGNLRGGTLTNIALPAPTGKLTLYFDDNSMEDLWIAITWGKAP